MAPRKKPARQEPRIPSDEPTQVPPSSISVPATATTVRRRQGPNIAVSSPNQKMRDDGGAAAARSSTDGKSTSDSVRESHTTPSASPSWATRNQWIVLAVASGACAAFNGVFAKLTTNNLTTHIAEAVSGLLGLNNMEQPIEYIVRAVSVPSKRCGILLSLPVSRNTNRIIINQKGFFGLNLAFNGVMWTLFTKALARGSSTTQVSIMNTSANFVITAILGLAIFAESLPPLWWLGAALLVAGNVIIGRKDEGAGEDAATASTTEEDSMSEQPLLGEQQPHYDNGVAENIVAAGIMAGGVAAIGAAAQVDETSPGIEKDEDDEDEDVAVIGDLESQEL
ncbi:uncharacterized protein PG998_003778 [Apiospora kogelbergensis]|uniref:uncharacterized protein n=1 Tax=Apiospora kogelbergensis TaxID=1337665 RepID=UPI003131949E